MRRFFAPARYNGSGDDILAETDASGNTTAEYIFFGGKRIAMLPAGGNPTYYVEDMLGTSRVLTTNTGVVCYDADFYPYGGERSYTNTCPQNYKFEGKERDTETGNDDFGARYYSNRFGRWLSADWSAVPEAVPYANLSNPQTLNLYAMVSDDPESFADLDGHCDPGLNCLESNLKTAASQIAGAYEKAGKAVISLVNGVGGELGAGAGQLIGGLASGDDKMASEGADKIGPTVALTLLTDGEAELGLGTRAEGIEAASPTEIVIDGSRYPESAQHAADAQAAGQPDVLTVDRAGASARRTDALKGSTSTPGMDRDEYPPAFTREGGAGASRRSISRSDNRGAGASMGNQARKVPDGGRIRIVPKPKTRGGPTVSKTGGFITKGSGDPARPTTQPVGGPN